MEGTRVAGIGSIAGPQQMLGRKAKMGGTGSLADQIRVRVIESSTVRASKSYLERDGAVPDPLLQPAEVGGAHFRLGVFGRARTTGGSSNQVQQTFPMDGPANV